MNFCYILRCADDTLYTGWTKDLAQRLAAHNAGRGSKYTRVRRPVELVYSEAFDSKEEAMSREWHLKRLTRQQKLRLIASHQGEETPERPGQIDDQERQDDGR